MPTNSQTGATSGDGFWWSRSISINGTEHWNSAPSVFSKQIEGQLFLIQQQTLLKKQ